MRPLQVSALTAARPISARETHWQHSTLFEGEVVFDMHTVLVRHVNLKGIIAANVG